MLIRLLHKLPLTGRLRLDPAAGRADKVYARIAPHLRASASRPTILDVGGGTGTMRRFWPAPSKYICMDIEMPSFEGFVQSLATDSRSFATRPRCRSVMALLTP